MRRDLALHDAGYSWNTKTETIAALLAGYDCKLREIQQLRAALEPFADIPGEADEDFTDDTAATVRVGRTTHYALKLGDFRRARAAMTVADEQSERAEDR